jgi:hypothetical protein
MAKVGNQRGLKVRVTGDRDRMYLLSPDSACI